MASAIAVNRLEKKAQEVSATLRLLANEKRLLVLCQLSLAGEMSVTALGEEVGLGQSALSQHLAKLRADELVATRREGQTLFYRIADGRIGQVLEALYGIYCAPPNKEKKK
jgi:DNA-binding transcriptional ArsR family regulator